jgi:hypothetical protein
MLVEAHDTLVLIDTGFELRDISDTRSRLSPFFLALLAPDFREEFTASATSRRSATTRAMYSVSFRRIWISAMPADWTTSRMQKCTCLPRKRQSLRELKRDHANAVRIMSSHDVHEFEAAAHRNIMTLSRHLVLA